MSEENTSNEVKAKSVVAEPKNYEKTFEEFGVALKSVSDRTKGLDVDNLPSKKAMEDLENRVVSFEEQSQKTSLENQRKEKADKEMTERMDLIEKQMHRPSTGFDVNEKKEELKALNYFARNEFKDMDQANHKILRTDVLDSAGALVPIGLSDRLRERREETSAVRSIITVEPTSFKTIEVAVRVGVPDAFYEGETEESQEDESKYENRQITNNALTVTVSVTRDQLMGARFNMETLINRDVRIGFNKKEGLKVLATGTGTKEPEALMLAPGVPEFDSGIANAVDLQTFIQLPGQLKALEDFSNPIYIMNRRTFVNLLSQQASGSGEFHMGTLFTPGNRAAQIPSLLAGYEFVLLNDMDDVAANDFPIAFGDFREAYTLYEWDSMEVIRDITTQKKKRLVEFTFTTYNTGHVIIPDAFVKYKIAA